MENSEVEIDVNEIELSLYLVSNMTQEEVDHEGWNECCHTKRNGGNRRPGITSKEIMGDRKNGESLWRPPIRRPSPVETKRMTAKMLEIAVIQVMRNNVYNFAGEIWLQSEGGAIGVRATGDIAKAVMVHWDKKFNMLLDSNLSSWTSYCPGP